MDRLASSGAHAALVHESMTLEPIRIGIDVAHPIAGRGSDKAR